MAKGTNNRIALLQGLLATFTGGSLILFAVLAATIGLSTPQSRSPSIAGSGSGAGGVVTVPGIGSARNPPVTTTPPGPGGPATATPSGAPGVPTTPAVAVDRSAVNPSEPTAVAQTSGGIGLQVPEFLTPGATTIAGTPPIGAPIRSTGFVATTNDELPDSFKERFGAGNALGARDVEVADRVAKHLGRKALRKAAKAPVKATSKATSKADKHRGGPAVGGGQATEKSRRGERTEAKHTEKATRKTERDQHTNAKKAHEKRKESKKAHKEAKREGKEAKKEDHGRSTIGGDNDDKDDD